VSELGPDSRALVDAARSGLGPDEIAIRRMRARVAATIVAGTGTAVIAGHAANAATTAAATTATTAAATTTATATAAAATGASIAVKVAVAIAIGTAAIGSGVHVVRSRAAAPPVKAPVVELPASAPSRELDRAELAPPIVAHVREAPPAVTAPPPPPHHAVPAPAPISLARETTLVDAAVVALSNGRTADALLAIRRYTVETHGQGQLAEDAMAIEVEARCRLGDARAAAVFAAFDARWPHAAEHAKLAAACAR
jgi:hypothetical protein